MKKMMLFAIAIMLTIAMLPSVVMAETTISKELSQTEASLGDHITVTLNVSVAEDGIPLAIVDSLPAGLSYISDTFTVNGDSAEPTIDNDQVSYVLEAAGGYTISFDVQVTESQGDNITVTNTVAVGNVTAQADLTILPYAGFTKTVEEGELVVPVETDVQWLLVIAVENIADDQIEVMRDVMVKDNLGGDLELDDYTVSVGELGIRETGKTKKVHLTWNMGGDLEDGTSTSLALLISTDINTGTGNGKKAGHQEYTEPGQHDLNSGAVLKFVDSETGLQLSAHTPPITVLAE